VALALGVVLLFYPGIKPWPIGGGEFYAWLAVMMATFVAGTIFREFYKGARARAYGSGENFVEAVINLTLRNTRRYGGYIIHFGFVLLFIGWSGQAFKVDVPGIEAGIGETFNVRNYIFRVDDLKVADDPNFTAQRATVSLFENQKKVAVLYPEQRHYKAGEQQGTSEVSLRSTIKEDVYLVFQGGNSDGSKAIFQLYINPLTSWVWAGGVVLGLGTLIAMLPNKKTSPRRPSRRRMEEGKEVEAVS